MNFRRTGSDEPEINLIPFIDVLLVVLIFLTLTTTYSRFSELQVNLPVAQAEPTRAHPREVVVAVGHDGRYLVNRQAIEGPAMEGLVRALRNQAQAEGEVVLVISADAGATHQAVVNVMDAARRTGLNQITFATQHGGQP